MRPPSPETERSARGGRRVGEPDGMDAGALRAGHRVLRMLSTGSRSRVWLAEGDRVLKVLTPPVAPGQPTAEVEALHRARGEHVVEVLDVSSDGDEVVLVFPRLARGSLADVLMARREVDAGEAVTALVPVARTLARMHAAGVAHGDLRAGAILFRADGAPVLTGFGSAVLFEPGLPEVRRERIEAVVSDRVALAAMARDLLARVTGPRADAAHALARRLDPPALEDLETWLVGELFELAAARPVVLDVQDDDVRGSGRIVAVGEPPVAEPEATQGVGRVRALALQALESGPVELVTRETRRRWRELSPFRRRLVAGGGAGALALLVLICVLPDGDGLPGEPLPGTAVPPQPPAAAPLLPAPPAAGGDPLAALDDLLARRAECIRRLSVLCLDDVDQSGSSAAVQDRAWIDAVVAAADPPPLISAGGARIAERLGDSVLIVLAPDSDPASILLMRTEAGWRIRDYLAATPEV